MASLADESFRALESRLEALESSTAIGDEAGYGDFEVPDIDPVEELRNKYFRFCAFGRGHRVRVHKLKMDSRTWLKFCRDSGIVNSDLNRTRIDLIFTKVAGRGKKTVDFEGFLECLRSAAISRKTTYALLVMHIIESQVTPTIGGHSNLAGAMNAPGSPIFNNSILDVKDQALSAYTVREANENDLDDILVLFAALGETSKATDVQINISAMIAGLTHGLQSNTSNRYWVVVYAGTHKPVGFVSIVQVWNDWEACNDWMLTQIYVQQEHRRRQLGKRLLQKVKTVALDENVGSIKARLQTNNLAGKRFLETQHFMSEAHTFTMKLSNLSQ